MKQSASAYFPFSTDKENNCLRRTHNVEDAVCSAIRIFCITRKGSRLGNPKGSIIPDLKFQLIKNENLRLLSSEFRNELIQQFPGVNFINVDFQNKTEKDFVGLAINITMTIGNSTNIIEFTYDLPSKFE